MTKQNEGKSGNRKQTKGASVRITGEDAKLLKAIRLRIKSKPGVGNVRAGEIVSMALRLVGEAQVRELQERAVTTKHKKEQLRQKYVAVRGAISPKEFDEFMTTPGYAEFCWSNTRSNPRRRSRRSKVELMKRGLQRSGLQSAFLLKPEWLQ